MTSISTRQNLTNMPRPICQTNQEHVSWLYFLPPSSSRVAEGGLRTHGLYKENKSDLPLITVITVVYNGIAHIEETIQSVLNQTWTNIEYIVIDGGSTDGTIDLLAKYNDCIDYWVSEKDSGISDAFNKGIRCATGNYIGIINADDWYELGTIENVANTILRSGSEGVVCGKVRYWKNGSIDSIFDSNPNRLHLEMTVNHPSCFVSRVIYSKYGVFHTSLRFAMDYEIMLRFWTNKVEFISLSQILANMRLDGASDKNWKKAFHESMLVKRSLMNEMFQPRLYYYFQILRRHTRNALLRVGLERIVKIVRNRCSVLKKTQDVS